MDALFATGSKFMQSVRQKLACIDINSDSIEGKASVWINSHFFYELWFPMDELIEKIIYFWLIIQKILSFVVFCESAFAIFLVFHLPAYWREYQEQKYKTK